MTRSKIRFLPAGEAVSLIRDGATVATGGFVGCGHPEDLTAAIEQRFLAHGAPRDLTLIYAAGQGDGTVRGLNHLGHEGLVRRVIGGHWNLAPRLCALATSGRIEAYNFPQGVISKLFREIASGNPGLLSRTGLGTYIDPRDGGGRLNAETTGDLVEVVTLAGQELLFYHAHPIDVALIRGTASDANGNISFEREVMTGETLAMATAARNSGGIVLAQVERIVPEFSRDPKLIHVPGIFVDAVVVSPPEHHMQTFGSQFDPGYVTSAPLNGLSLASVEAGPRRYIAARCLTEIRRGEIVNLGIGISEGIARLAVERGVLDDFTLTVESGAIGGMPAGGLDFGAALHPAAIIDQPSMFDFYDGGGLNIAFLSMAECDSAGNVNVSRYSGKLPGCGGFMNIAQSARRVVFTGTFTSRGLETRWDGTRLEIVREGCLRKFVRRVEQVTFSAARALAASRPILYVTERAVFELTPAGLELIEVAPGIDVRSQVLDLMDFRPAIRQPLARMPESVFRPPTGATSRQEPEMPPGGRCDSSDRSQ